MDIKTLELIAVKIEAIISDKSSINTDPRCRTVQLLQIPFPTFLAADLKRVKDEAGEQRQAIQQMQEFRIEEANELIKQEIRHSRERHVMYISAFDLGWAEQLLSTFHSSNPPIERIIIRRMSETTRQHLAPFLPSSLEAIYQHNKAKLGRLKFASTKGFINDTSPWSLLPPFHGVLYGQILSWGRWEVDDEGMLTLQRAAMHVIRETHDENLFARCRKLITDWDTL